MPPDEKRIRTLVIDDASDFMQAICSFLENLPNVAVIATGRTGLRRDRAGSRVDARIGPDGHQNAEMTGLEATFQLTRDLADVIVVLMTAVEDEKTLRASKESGAFAFVMKENLTHDLPRLLELAASEKGWMLRNQLHSN